MKSINQSKSQIRNWNWFAILIISVVALGVFGTGMSFLEQSAKDEMLARKAPGYQPTLLGRVNPFLPDPLADADSAAFERIFVRRFAAFSR
ncbi:MAG: hypothetical protein IPK58_11150 [Acidobacteria bacterium]|nr:hypothetical protein [Acidobacteriota bacterium]